MGWPRLSAHGWPPAERAAWGAPGFPTCGPASSELPRCPTSGPPGPLGKATWEVPWEMTAFLWHQNSSGETWGFPIIESYRTWTTKNSGSRHAVLQNLIWRIHKCENSLVNWNINQQTSANEINFQRKATNWDTLDKSPQKTGGDDDKHKHTYMIENGWTYTYTIVGSVCNIS